MRSARSALLLVSASVIAFAASARAETAAPDEATAKAPQTTTVGEVVVTGSRVIKNGNNSPTPVTVVSTGELLTAKPTTVSDALNDLPVFSGSRGQTSNPGNGYATQPTTANNSGSFLNLRNLGNSRTLVLFDGHRVPPTSPDGLIDTNMIPEMLLQRVDVVTGGASAIYGSDAIGGVVNFITDTHFDGLKLEAQGGESNYGDDLSYKFGAAVGTKLFDGRGHFEGSYEYYNDDGILSRRTRQWDRYDYTVQGAGTTGDPYHLVENTRISTAAFGGLITTGPLAGQYFANNGILSPFAHGAPTGTNGYESGGDGAYFNSSLKSPLERQQLFARFDYDLTKNIQAYVDISGAINHDSVVYTQQNLSNYVYSAQNGFLAPGYQTQLAQANVSTFKMGEIAYDLPAASPETFEGQWFVNGGLKGSFWDGYKWDLSYMHGETRQETLVNGNINKERLSAALDAVTSGGQVVCNVTLTNPGLYPGCAPLNLFGPSSASQAAANYISQTTGFTAHTVMDDVSASVTGAPFSTWAGAVNMAVSGEWRRLGYSAVSDARPTDLMNCTGLRYNCTPGAQLWLDGSFSNRSPVSQTVAEGALEMDAPLLKDAPFAKALNFDGAVRFTNYDTSGSAWTWKLGLDWRIDDQLLLRATQSHDIRAPTLNDLYGPESVGSGSFTDLLTGASYLAPTLSGGNPNLKPEVADTSTGGFVWRPHFIPHFSLALDAFDITIKNAITNLQGTNPSVQQVCYASGGASPYCALQIRPGGFTNTSPSNQVTEWLYTEVNVATQQTYGADFEANYSANLFGHPLGLRGFLTWQPHIVYKTPGLNTVDLGGVAFSSNALQASPKLRMTIFARYTVDNFTVDLTERWRSDLGWTGDSTQIFSQPKIPSIQYTDVNLMYQLKQAYGQTELFLNVQNLFNTSPPPAAFLGGNGAVGLLGGFAYGDDPIGRYFTVGVRFKR